jgi:hypothetical protein
MRKVSLSEAGNLPPSGPCSAAPSVVKWAPQWAVWSGPSMVRVMGSADEEEE